MEIENERNELDSHGFISGQIKGWAATTWTGDGGFPESYIFKIYSPTSGQVRVNLTVGTSAGHFRILKSKERRDLKQAIAKHY